MSPNSLRNRIFFLVSFLLFNAITISGQSRLDIIRIQKETYISYGKFFTGTGDLWGDKFYLGNRYGITKNLFADVNIAGTLLNEVLYFEGNPEWDRIDISNGLELSGVLGFKIGEKKVSISPFFGPSVRYSNEYHSRSFGITYNHDSGAYDWFCEYDEDLGFRSGFHTGIIVEFKIKERLVIGPMLALNYYPRNSYTFSYIGISAYLHRKK